VGKPECGKNSRTEVAEELNWGGKPFFWVQCHYVGAEGSLHADGSPVGLPVWRVKANQGWLRKEREPCGVGRPGAESPEEMGAGDGRGRLAAGCDCRALLAGCLCSA